LSNTTVALPLSHYTTQLQDVSQECSYRRMVQLTMVTRRMVQLTMVTRRMVQLTMVTSSC